MYTPKQIYIQNTKIRENRIYNDKKDRLQKRNVR